MKKLASLRFLFSFLLLFLFFAGALSQNVKVDGQVKLVFETKQLTKTEAEAIVSGPASERYVDLWTYAYFSEQGFSKYFQEIDGKILGDFVFQANSHSFMLVDENGDESQAVDVARFAVGGDAPSCSDLASRLHQPTGLLYRKGMIPTFRDRVCPTWAYYAETTTGSLEAVLEDGWYKVKLYVVRFEYSKAESFYVSFYAGDAKNDGAATGALTFNIANSSGNPMVWKNSDGTSTSWVNGAGLGNDPVSNPDPTIMELLPGGVEILSGIDGNLVLNPACPGAEMTGQLTDMTFPSGENWSDYTVSYQLKTGGSLKSINFGSDITITPDPAGTVNSVYDVTLSTSVLAANPDADSLIITFVQGGETKLRLSAAVVVHTIPTLYFAASAEDDYLWTGTVYDKTQGSPSSIRIPINTKFVGKWFCSDILTGAPAGAEFKKYLGCGMDESNRPIVSEITLFRSDTEEGTYKQVTNAQTDPTSLGTPAYTLSKSGYFYVQVLFNNGCYAKTEIVHVIAEEPLPTPVITVSSECNKAFTAVATVDYSVQPSDWEWVVRSTGSLTPADQADGSYGFGLSTNGEDGFPQQVAMPGSFSSGYFELTASGMQSKVEAVFSYDLGPCYSIFPTGVSGAWGSLPSDITGKSVLNKYVAARCKIDGVWTEWTMVPTVKTAAGCGTNANTIPADLNSSFGDDQFHIGVSATSCLSNTMGSYGPNYFCQGSDTTVEIGSSVRFRFLYDGALIYGVNSNYKIPTNQTLNKTGIQVVWQVSTEDDPTWKTWFVSGSTADKTGTTPSVFKEISPSSIVYQVLSPERIITQKEKHRAVILWQGCPMATTDFPEEGDEYYGHGDEGKDNVFGSAAFATYEDYATVNIKSDIITGTLKASVDEDPFTSSNREICYGSRLDLQLDGYGGSAANLSWEVSYNQGSKWDPVYPQPGKLQYQDVPVVDAEDLYAGRTVWYRVKVTEGDQSAYTNEIKLTIYKAKPLSITYIPNDGGGVGSRKDTVAGFCNGTSITVMATETYMGDPSSLITVLPEGVQNLYFQYVKESDPLTAKFPASLLSNTVPPDPKGNFAVQTLTEKWSSYRIISYNQGCYAIGDTIILKTNPQITNGEVTLPEKVCKGEEISLTVEGGSAESYDWMVPASGASTGSATESLPTHEKTIKLTFPISNDQDGDVVSYKGFTEFGRDGSITKCYAVNGKNITVVAQSCSLPALTPDKTSLCSGSEDLGLTWTGDFSAGTWTLESSANGTDGWTTVPSSDYTQSGSKITLKKTSSLLANAGNLYFRIVQGGVNGNASQVVTVKQSPTLDVYDLKVNGKDAEEVCAGTAVNFVATPAAAEGLSYEWYRDMAPVFDDTDKPSIASATTSDAGTYYVNITKTENGCSVSAYTEVTLDVNPVPEDFTVTVPAAEICEGQSHTFEPSVNPASPSGVTYTYSWTGDATSSDKDLVVGTPSAGSYDYSLEVTATATDGGCQLKKTASTTLTVNGLPVTPVVTSGPDVSICQGGSGSVSATVEPASQDGVTYKYDWYDDANLLVKSGTSDATLDFPSDMALPGTGQHKYYLKVTATTTASGCTAESVRPAALTTLTVEVCSEDQMASVEKCPADAIAELELVPGTPAPSKVDWMQSETGSDPWVEAEGTPRYADGKYYFKPQSAPAPGTMRYYKAVITRSGQAETKEVTATYTVWPNPVLTSVTAQADAGSYCGGETIRLTAATVPAQASGGESFAYSWTGPGGFSSTEQNPQVVLEEGASFSGTYTVTVTATSAKGCTLDQSGSTASVTVNPLPAKPSVSIAGATTVCEGSPVTLTASVSPEAGSGVGYAYVWSGPGVDAGHATGADQQQLSIAAAATGDAGSYTVSVTATQASCSAEAATATAELKVTSKPQITDPSLSISPESVCENGKVTLTVSPSSGSGTYTYVWTGPEGTIVEAENQSSYTISSARTEDAGQYKVVIGYTEGSCSADPVEVSASLAVNALPTQPGVSISTGAGSLCTGDSYELTARITTALDADQYAVVWYKDGSPVKGDKGTFVGKDALDEALKLTFGTGGSDVSTGTASNSSYTVQVIAKSAEGCEIEGVASAGVTVEVVACGSDDIAEDAIEVCPDIEKQAFTLEYAAGAESVRWEYSTNGSSWQADNGSGCDAVGPDAGTCEYLPEHVPAAGQTYSYKAYVTRKGTERETKVVTYAVYPQTPEPVVGIDKNPVSDAYCPGTDLTLSANVSNSTAYASLTYSWKNSGTVQPSPANGASVSLTGLTSGMAGTYTVTVVGQDANKCTAQAETSVEVTLSPAPEKAEIETDLKASVFCVGSPASLVVTTVAKDQEYTYNWYQGSKLVFSETNSAGSSTLRFGDGQTLPSASASTGDYQVQVSTTTANGCSDSVASAKVRIQFNICSEPTLSPVAHCPGEGPQALTFNYSDPQPQTVTWMVDKGSGFVAVTGGYVTTCNSFTSPSGSCTFTPASGDVPPAGQTYTFKAVLDQGLGTERECTATYEVYENPQQAQNLVVAPSESAFCEGSEVELSVNHDKTDGYTYTYQWKKDGSPVASSQTYKAVLDKTATYTVEVTASSAEKCTASVATASKEITVKPIPVIDNVNVAVDPSDVCEGSDVTMTATPSPDNTVSGVNYAYRWMKQGTTDTLDRDAELAIAKEDVVNGTTYLVLVRATQDACSSSWKVGHATLNVTDTVDLTDMAIAGAVADKCLGSGAVTLKLAGSASGKIKTYQWKKDGNPIGGAVSSTYEVADDLASNASYSCLITAYDNLQCPSQIEVKAVAVSFTVCDEKIEPDPSSPEGSYSEQDALVWLCENEVDKTASVQYDPQSASEQITSLIWYKYDTDPTGTQDAGSEIKKIESAFSWPSVLTDKEVFGSESAPKRYFVRAKISRGAVETFTNTYTFYRLDQANPATDVTLDGGVVCQGTPFDLNLSATAPTVVEGQSAYQGYGISVSLDALQYIWTDPEGVRTVNTDKTFAANTADPVSDATYAVGVVSGQKYVINGTKTLTMVCRDTVDVEAQVTVNEKPDLKSVVVSVDPGTSVCQNQDVVFTATPDPASAPTITVPGETATYSYQWFFDGKAIAGAQSGTYEKNAVDPDTDKGEYSVQLVAHVSTGCNDTAVGKVNLEVAPSPQITDATLDCPGAVCAGDAFALILTSSATSGTASYQWYKASASTSDEDLFTSANRLSGATGPQYAVSPSDGSHSGKYGVEVTYSLGSCSASETRSCELTVNPAPAQPKVTQQVDSRICAGASGSWRASSSDGTSTYDFVWFKPDAGAEGGYALIKEEKGVKVSSLAFGPSLPDADIVSEEASNGTYRLYVISREGDCADTLKIDQAFDLSACSDPNLANVSVCPGTEVQPMRFFYTDERSEVASTKFFIVDGGDTELSSPDDYTLGPNTGSAPAFEFAFTLAEKHLPAAGSSITIKAVNYGGEGNELTSTLGTYTVHPQAVAPNDLKIAVDPLEYCAAESLEMQAQFTPVEGYTYSYAWSGPDSYTSGNASTAKREPLAVSHTGKYTVVLSSFSKEHCPAGDVSANVDITVHPKPVISKLTLAALKVCQGEDAVFVPVIEPADGSTGADGIRYDYTYEWSKGTAPIVGESEGTLTLAEVDKEDADSYTLKVSVVSEEGCPAEASATAALTVVDTVDLSALAISGAKTGVCVGTGGDVTLSVPAVPGALSTTYQWYKDGVLIPDATAREYVVKNGLANMGDYACYVAVRSNPDQCTSERMLDAVSVGFAMCGGEVVSGGGSDASFDNDKAVALLCESDLGGDFVLDYEPSTAKDEVTKVEWYVFASRPDTDTPDAGSPVQTDEAPISWPLSLSAGKVFADPDDQAPRQKFVRAKISRGSVVSHSTVYELYLLGQALPVSDMRLDPDAVDVCQGTELTLTASATSGGLADQGVYEAYGMVVSEEALQYVWTEPSKPEVTNTDNTWEVDTENPMDNVQYKVSFISGQKYVLESLQRVCSTRTDEATASVTVKEVPQLTSVDLVVPVAACEGETVTLTTTVDPVDPASLTPSGTLYRYRWYFQGTVIEDAEASTLQREAVEANKGMYKFEVIAYSPQGCRDSLSVEKELKVNDTVDLSGVAVSGAGEKCLGDGTLVLSLSGVPSVSLPSTVSYQWYKDGSEISGAGSATYEVADALGSTGEYACRVSVDNPLTSCNSQRMTDPVAVTYKMCGDETLSPDPGNNPDDLTQNGSVLMVCAVGDETNTAGVSYQPKVGQDAVDQVAWYRYTVDPTKEKPSDSTLLRSLDKPGGGFSWPLNLSNAEVFEDAAANVRFFVRAKITRGAETSFSSVYEFVKLANAPGASGAHLDPSALEVCQGSAFAFEVKDASLASPSTPVWDGLDASAEALSYLWQRPDNSVVEGSARYDGTDAQAKDEGDYYASVITGYRYSHGATSLEKVCRDTLKIGPAVLDVSDPSVAGTVSKTGGDICLPDFSSLSFQLSGNTGAVLHWQISTQSDFGASVVDLEETSATLSVSEEDVASLLEADGQTTLYVRAVVQNGSCDPANTDAVSFTAYAQPSGDLAFTNSPEADLNDKEIVLDLGDNAQIGLSSAIGTTFRLEQFVSSEEAPLEKSFSYKTDVSVSGGTGSVQQTMGLDNRVYTFYRVEIANGVCPSFYTDTIRVEVTDPGRPGFQFEENPICESQHVGLKFIESPTADVDLNTVAWYYRLQQEPAADASPIEVDPAISEGILQTQVRDLLVAGTYEFFFSYQLKGEPQTFYSDTLSIELSSEPEAGLQFKDHSGEASLTVCQGETVPFRLTGLVGSVKAFEQDASGDGSYETQLSPLGADPEDLLYELNTESLSGTYKYRVQLENGACETYTGELTLNVLAYPELDGGIAVAPADDCAGSEFVLTAQEKVPGGSVLAHTWQWQRYDAASDSWSDVSEGAHASGCSFSGTNSLSLTITDATPEVAGRYRLVFKVTESGASCENAVVSTDKEASVVVKIAPVAQLSPAPKVLLKTGQNQAVSVELKNLSDLGYDPAYVIMEEPTSYAWYAHAKGGADGYQHLDGMNHTGFYTGAYDQDILTVVGDLANDSTLFYVELANACGTFRTDADTLRVNDGFRIETVDDKYYSGEPSLEVAGPLCSNDATAVYAISVTTNGPVSQDPVWEVSDDMGTSWERVVAGPVPQQADAVYEIERDDAAFTYVLKVLHPTLAMDGWKFRASFTDGEDSDDTFSQELVLEVDAPVVFLCEDDAVLSKTEPVVVVGGTPASSDFTADAACLPGTDPYDGYTFEYWQQGPKDADFAKVASTKDFSFASAAESGMYYFRFIMANHCGSDTAVDSVYAILPLVPGDITAIEKTPLDPEDPEVEADSLLDEVGPQPGDLSFTVCEGNRAAFVAPASGGPAQSAFWETSQDGIEPYQPVDLAETCYSVSGDTLWIDPVSLLMEGWHFRRAFALPAQIDTLYSPVFTLHVNAKPDTAGQGIRLLVVDLTDEQGDREMNPGEARLDHKVELRVVDAEGNAYDGADNYCFMQYDPSDPDNPKELGCQTSTIFTLTDKATVEEHDSTLYFVKMFNECGYTATPISLLRVFDTLIVRWVPDTVYYAAEDDWTVDSIKNVVPGDLVVLASPVDSVQLQAHLFACENSLVEVSDTVIRGFMNRYNTGNTQRSYWQYRETPQSPWLEANTSDEFWSNITIEEKYGYLLIEAFPELDGYQIRGVAVNAHYSDTTAILTLHVMPALEDGDLVLSPADTSFCREGRVDFRLSEVSGSSLDGLDIRWQLCRPGSDWVEIDTLDGKLHFDAGLLTYADSGLRVMAVAKSLCGTDTAYAEVHVEKPLVPEVDLALLPDTVLCFGTGLSLEAVATHAGEDPVYAWYLDGVLLEGVEGNRFETDTLPVGRHRFEVRLRVTDQEACIYPDTASDQVSVTVHPLPEIQAYIADSVIKAMDTTRVWVESTGNMTRIEWQPASWLINPDSARTATVPMSEPGAYEFVVRVANEFGCEDYDTVRLRVESDFTFDSLVIGVIVPPVLPNGGGELPGFPDEGFDPADGDVFSEITYRGDTAHMWVCAGNVSLIKLATTGGTEPLSYTWYAFDGNAEMYLPQGTAFGETYAGADSVFGFFFPDTTTTRMLCVVEDANRTGDSVHVFVHYHTPEPFYIEVLPKVTSGKFYENQAVYFQARPQRGHDIAWIVMEEGRVSDLVVNREASKHMAFDKESGENTSVWISTVDRNGCRIWDSAAVEIIALPNVMIIDDPKEGVIFPEFEVEITNMWGLRVKAFGQRNGNGTSKGWDGRAGNGTKVAAGTYYYKVKIPTAESPGYRLVEGAVTVINK